jgi:hypothetical protein
MVQPEASSSKRAMSPSPEPEDSEKVDVYVPVAKRRAMKLAALGKRVAKDRVGHEVKSNPQDAMEEEEEEEMLKREKARHHQTLLQEAQEVKRRKAIEGDYQNLRCPS